MINDRKGPYAGNELGRLLFEEGLIPPECVDVEILVPVDGIFRIRYTVNLLKEDLSKLGRALKRLGDGE